jgi:hypothetical protein
MEDTPYNKLLKRLSELTTAPKIAPEDADLEAKLRAQELEASPLSGLSKIAANLPKLNTEKYTNDTLSKIYDRMAAKGMVNGLSKEDFINKQNEHMNTMMQAATLSGGISPVKGSTAFSRMGARMAPTEVPEGFGGKLSAAQEVEQGMVPEAPAALKPAPEAIPAKPYELPKMPANRKTLGAPAAELEYTPTEKATMDTTLQSKVAGTTPTDAAEEFAMRGDRKRAMDKWLKEGSPSLKGDTVVSE